MADFTPGPWTVERASWSREGFAQYELAGVLQVSAIDARLIAEAPAMYEALRLAVTNEAKADGLRGSGMVDDSDIKALRAVADRARSILARIEGGAVNA